MTAPIPAATLVLFRQRGRVPELLFVERSKAMVFAGGALVFPGGRIDPGDRALALELGGDPEDMAARIGAIRETIEEVGLPIGLPPMPDAIFAELRAALHRGEALGAVLRELDLALDPAQLVPFARWLPSHAPARRAEGKRARADPLHDPWARAPRAASGRHPRRGCRARGPLIALISYGPAGGSSAQGGYCTSTLLCCVYVRGC